MVDLADLSDRSTLMEILDHVRQRFPNCLESDILLINCCWELLLQWHAQPLILSSDLYQTLNYLDKVSSSVLKHNVACMGWRLFIQKRFETLCNLTEKMGRKPKDRICRKELEMGMFWVPILLGFLGSKTNIHFRLTQTKTPWNNSPTFAVIYSIL